MTGASSRESLITLEEATESWQSKKNTALGRLAWWTCTRVKSYGTFGLQRIFFIASMQEIMKALSFGGYSMVWKRGKKMCSEEGGSCKIIQENEV